MPVTNAIGAAYTVSWNVAVQVVLSAFVLFVCYSITLITCNFLLFKYYISWK